MAESSRADRTDRPDRDFFDQILDFQIRDYSAYAVALHGKLNASAGQQVWALAAVRRRSPIADRSRFDLWQQVKSYDGAPSRCTRTAGLRRLQH